MYSTLFDPATPIARRSRRETTILSCIHARSQADLLELYDYIAERSSADRALEYIQRIQKQILSLESFPERGTLRDDIRPGLRVVGFEHRVSIAFRVKGETVTILRILYSGRDLAGDLEKGLNAKAAL